jgi:hypothetical protein
MCRKARFAGAIGISLSGGRISLCPTANACGANHGGLPAAVLNSENFVSSGTLVGLSKTML